MYEQVCDCRNNIGVLAILSIIGNLFYQDKQSVTESENLEGKTDLALTPKTSQQSTQPAKASCAPSYPDFCIASPPPDLDCGDISQKRFTVLSPDPHKFDRDNDGIGCE